MPIPQTGACARAFSWRTTTPRRGATGKAPTGPYGKYFLNLRTKRLSRGAADVFKHDLAVTDEAVTVDYMLDHMVHRRQRSSSVVDQLLAFRERIGDFGTLLYCGHDWADTKLARRSMELMAEKVMPAVNAAIGGGTRAA